MDLVRRILFIVIFLLFLQNIGNSQEIKRSSFFIEETLNHQSFAENSNGRQILSLLASNNVQSLNWVEIKVRANMLIQLNRAEIGQVSATLVLTNYNLTGELFFRDFLLDSLLMPDIIEGRIILYEKDRKLVSRPWLLASRSGRVDLHVPDSISVSEDDLRVEIRIDQLLYSQQQFEAFERFAILINRYYSFVSVLTDLVETYRKNDLGKDQPPSLIGQFLHEN